MVNAVLVDLVCHGEPRWTQAGSHRTIVNTVHPSTLRHSPPRTTLKIHPEICGAQRTAKRGVFEGRAARQPEIIDVTPAFSQVVCHER